jgi:hypothetical protein
MQAARPVGGVGGTAASGLEAMNPVRGNGPVRFSWTSDDSEWQRCNGREISRPQANAADARLRENVMESALNFIRQKPWLVFILLFAAGMVCGFLEMSRPAVALFMLSGLLVMWQSTVMAPWKG